MKNIIEFHDEVLPLGRATIASYLKEIYLRRGELNPTEKKQLDWYIKEYHQETGIGEDRYYLYSYTDSLFRFNTIPILEYTLFNEKGSGHRRAGGFSFWGTYGDYFSASFDFRDVGEFGKNIDSNRYFTPQRGGVPREVNGGFELSDAKGSVTYNWKWGSVSLIKDYFQWGHGKFGQLIYSWKASSYTRLQLQFNPVDWFRFHYFHGFLSSLVIDSAASYPTGLVIQGNTVYSERFISKYVVANMLSLTPWEELDVSFGNSVIYSGSGISPEYLIPFMYYKVLDHNLGRDNDQGSNGQLYFDLKWTYPQTYMFYYTLFVDVLSIRDILKGDMNTTWFGITLGGKKIDALIENLDLTVEYTRLNPWLYEHYVPTTTYKHLNYPLGHWLGQNADQLRVQFDYAYSDQLRMSLWGENLRKGGLKGIEYAYAIPDTEPFLYGPVRKELNGGIEINYSYMHDIWAKLQLEYRNGKDEDSGRLNPYRNTSRFYFSIGLGCGL